MNSGEDQNPLEDRFEFGQNWWDFVNTQLTPTRLATSRQKLLQLLNVADLQGKTFLDIGSGSGLHSLAAWQSGAAHVTSFDYDPQSVEATRRLHALAGSPENWTIMPGDVLNVEFLSTLSLHDVVYSWGVLHHTGAMWDAIRNASQLLAQGGIFCIALYTLDAYVNPSADFWLAVKQRYNRAGTFERAAWEWWYFCRFCVLSDLKHRRNPFRRFHHYHQSRGMSQWTDIRDWLGGWPMEFAGILETRAFCRDQLGLNLAWMSSGEACTEYVFFRNSEESPAETENTNIQHVLLPGPFRNLKKSAFSCQLPELPEKASGTSSSQYSNWMLYQDWQPMTFSNAKFSAVAGRGGGRYYCQGRKLVFSTLDGSNPNANGCHYRLCRRIGPPLSPPAHEISFSESK